VGPGFDLAWVDGARGHPAVAWDPCNAYQLAAADGWIPCDDVLTQPEADAFAWVNTDSSEATEAIRRLDVVEVSYLLNRLAPVRRPAPPQARGRPAQASVLGAGGCARGRPVLIDAARARVRAAPQLWSESTPRTGPPPLGSHEPA
jgi:hypothetical protein